MNRLLALFSIICLSFCNSLTVMGQDISWVETAGGTSNDHGRAVQVDGASNLYVLGYFSAPSAWFGSASLSTSGTGTYLTKYSNAGNFLWARKISDTNVADAYGLKTDAAGNSYVVTTFMGTTTLGTATLTSSGASDIVIAKYTTNGDVVWATKAGGSAVDKGISITTDAAGNSYITGSFSGTAVFGNTSLSSAGSTDGFVAKLNANGSFAWAQKMGGNSADEGVSVVIDASGTVYVAGNFSSTFSLAGANLAYIGNQDIFLAAYSNAGTAQWARSAGGSYADKVSSLTIDGAGNLYLGGHFNRSANFGSVSITSSGNSQDIFLAKYTNTGAGVWATSAGGTGLDELSTLHADTDGNLYLTGSFSGRATIGGATLNSVGNLDIYAAHYASNGAAQWAIGAGSARDDRGLGIVSDAARNVYVTGYFQENTTNFGGIVIPNRGGEEIFISKLIPALVTTSVTAGPYCAGQAVTVNYKATRNFRNYSAQLSDEAGSFANPVQIGAATSNSTTGSIAATIPANTPAGSKYRIRVVASAANLAGTDNGTDLRINQVPAAPALTASSPGLGGTLFLTASDMPGATYSWTGPRGFTSNLQNPSRSGITDGDVGTYTVTVNVNGCTNTASVTMALSTVPTFDVDLRGQPNGYWDSPSVKRSGSVCGDDNCIVFNVILDPGAAGLELELLSGAMPGGAMYYKLNCGTQAAVGEPICVDNSGIVTISMCKPGNNANAFRIKSISPYDPQDDLSVTAGCSATLRAPLAFHEESIIWKDLTGGGEYLKYLDYTTGKREVTVSPDNNAPAYVDYEVTGTSMQSPCSSTPYADVIRVYFYPPPTIAIGPAPAIICPGGSGVALSGTVTGGDGDFNYIWTDPAGKVVSNQLSYTATAVGTYKLQVVPKNSSNCREFSATVAVVSNLSANAGPDQLVCSQRSVQLAGAVTAATGGVWSGGGGTFSPSNTALDAVYIPTAAEIAAGSVKLTLTSTGNGSCAAVKDDVLLTFYPFDVELAGTPVICSGTLGTVTAKALGGSGTISYQWSSGETTATILGKPAGTYTVTITDSKSCAISKSFTISEVAGPTGFTASAQPETCGASNGSVTVSGVTSGTAPYKYSIDGTKYQSATTFSGLADGNYTIYVQDANGCTVAKNITITNLAGPTAVAASTLAASCANNDGSITVGAVTGGAAPYTYSIDGTTFQNSTSFTGLASGNYTVAAKDANGCVVTTSATIAKETITNFTATAASSTCGASNASITVGNVIGGFSPYTYSKDGVNFQTSATLAGLAAGPYTVTVKDARGCVFSKSVTVGNTAGPTGLRATSKASTCGNSNAEITVTGVTGGTGSYSYSIDGVTFQASTSFTGLAAGNYTVYVKDANGCIYTEAVSLANIAGPDFTATATASTCGGSNGRISISGVTGGAAPYTYSKNGTAFQASTTFANLAAGTYSITVKDANGCSLVKSVTVTDIAGPGDFVLTANSSTCGASNGSVTVGAVTGGTAAYTYSINGGSFQSSTSFGSLAAGNYIITVKDANSCTFSKSITVTNVAGPTNLAATAKSSTCGASNGELTVTVVTGGTAPYTYSTDGVNFQTGLEFDNLVAGSHTITVKDANGCTFSKAFTVTNIAGPTAVAATTQPASCQNNDGSVSVGNITGGAAPYTYSINGTSFQSGTSFTGLASGVYTLTAKDANGCLITTTVTINQNVPTAFASSSVAAKCGRPDGQLTIGAVTGGTAPYTYSVDGGNFQASATFPNLLAGSYNVTVKDAKGCTFTDAVEVRNLEGPSINTTTTATTCGGANGSIKVSNTTGGVGSYTYSIDGTNFQNATTFNNLLAGTYTITAKDANGCFGDSQAVVENIAGPSFFELADASSTCGASNASITVRNVSGGTAPYTYSRDGVNFQASAVFSGLSATEYTITVKDANGCIISKAITLKDISGPSDFTLTLTASTCGNSNGKIEVDGVTGGTAPYTFSINGNTYQANAAFGGVSAGKYTLTVKDANGCTFAKEVAVGNNGGPTGLTASATSSTCGAANGKLTVTEISGGTAPYTYSTDGVNFQTGLEFDNLVAGSHTITVKDANGCTYSKAFTVANIAGPTAVTATTQSASCQNNDGSVSVGAVTGGTSSYTYAIDGTTFQSGSSFTSLASGVYTLTAKDANGCLITTTVTIKQNVPTAFASSSVAAKCGRPDGQLTIGAVTGGTAPYTYSNDGTNFQASATLQNLSAGTHTVTVKDAKGCTFSKAVTVSNTAGPSAINLSGSNSTCGGANATIAVKGVTGGTAPYTYSLDGTTFQSGASFGSLLAGEYEVTVKDANGCVVSQSITLEDIAGPAMFTASATASSCGRANGSITVGSVTGGTAPYTYSLDGANFQASNTLAGLLAGEHTITIKDANACVVSQKVILENVAGPTELELASIASTCGAANGSITINNVAGGTTPYTYSLDGSGFQSSPAFTGLLAGAYSITVKDANGCRFSAETTVENIAGPTNLTASTTSAACGASNGAISITNVSGGIAPYTYSIDGTNFQASAAFTALAAGTHTISVKDANGCIYVKAIEVTNQGGPSAIAATTQPASCQNNDGSVSVGNITGGTAPYTYSINGTSFQSGTSFTALASGEYTITVKDANGCAATKTVQVGKQGPAGFASTTRGAACGAENGQISVVSVDGGAAPYAYSINGGSFQSSAAFTSLSAGTYSITIQDANGCTFADEVEVANIEGPADLTASVGKTTCGNSNGQIKVDAVIGGTAPYTYSLDGVSFQGATTFAGLAAGEYQVTVKDVNGCTEAKAVTVANASGPNGFTVAGKASTCGAANGEATVSAVTGGTAPYTYSKDGANFQPDNTLTGLSEGAHTITVKDASGCTFTKQVVIESITGPTAYNLASVAATCGAANGAITVSDVTGGTAPYTYALNEGAFQTSAVFAEVTAGEHAITVKDANGCTLSQQVTVTGIAGPAAIAAAATPTACSADNGTITVSGVTGGTAPYTYSINEKEYQTAASFSGLAAGVYDVFVKDANGCSTSTRVTVSLKGPKEAVLAAAAATCGEENGSITITSVNGGTKPFAYSIDSNDFQAAATFANLAAGTYTITVKDAEGCTLVMTQQVSGSGGATFTATGTSASCGSSNGKVAVSNVSGGLSPYAYSINGNTFQSSPEFSGLAEGEYQVWVKDAAGCLSSKTVAISSTPPVSGVKAAVAAQSCGKAAGQLTISEVTGGTAPYTYSLDGTNFTSAATLEDVMPGAYTLTVKDATGCTYSTQVQMPESVSSTIDYVQHPNCFGTRTGEIALKATGANDQTQYSIDGGKTFQKSAVFQNLAAGTYQLITSFSATCSVNVGTVELKEPSELKVEVTPLTKAVGLEKSGSAAVTKISGGVGPYTYSLDGGSFSSDSVFTNLSSREYTLAMKDSRGCMATITFVIEGQGDIDIPNGFTPNGDGINDKWMLKNVAKLYPNCSVTVYNRWGSEVFASRGYTTPWDGTFKGKRLPDGTYYCIIELGDGTAPIKTSVTIMR